MINQDGWYDSMYVYGWSYVIDNYIYFVLGYTV